MINRTHFQCVLVLFPLELVQQLCSEHDLEVLPQAGGHLGDGRLAIQARVPRTTRAGSAVLDVVLKVKEKGLNYIF